MTTKDTFRQLRMVVSHLLHFFGISGLKSLLGDAYSSVFSGEATNEEAADTFASELDNLLEDYN